MKQLWPRVDWLVLGAAMLFGSLLFAIFANHGFDDPYITFRYARNLASGQGLVYNPGERVLSTTTPLYALLLAPIAAAGIELPLASNLVGCLAVGLGAAALWMLGRAWQAPLVGAVAGLLYCCAPLLLLTIGGETSLYIALVLWGFVAVAIGRHHLAALLLALAVLARADGALAVVCAGVAVAAKQRAALLRPYAPGPIPPDQRKHLLAALPLGAAATFIAVLAPWFLAAWAYYGSPLPATLAAKRRQASIPGSQSFFNGLLDLLGGLWAMPSYRLLLVLALIGAIYAMMRRRAWLLPLAWSCLYLLAYSMLGVTAYFWYYTPALVGLLVAAALGVEAVATATRQLIGPRVASLVVAALLLPMLAGQLFGLLSVAKNPDSRLPIYRAAAAWLAVNTAPDATVGSLEVGVIGYYARRKMIDFAGLLQPDVARVFGPQAGYPAAARWAIQRYQPDYLLLSERTLPLAQIDPGLDNSCSPVTTIDDGSPPGPLVIYRCRW